MRLSRIIQSLEKIAPISNAEPWDNVGLLAGDPDQNVSRILLTIDYSTAVADEARSGHYDLVVAYHPPIFHPLKRLTAGSLVYQAVRRGIAIYSPHTALDAAEGGTNDLLADMLGLVDRRPLRLPESKATQFKLVVFVPMDAVDAVSRALFEAGAGHIGNYDSCSFRSVGTGTFFGGKGTNPSVGRAGRLEKAGEIRLETVVPIAGVDAVLRALRASHPYEEPAFDLNILAPAPTSGKVGQGRFGLMPATPRRKIFDRIQRELKVDHLLIAGPTDRKISSAAICAGAGGEMLDDALNAGAELYLTGELRHHDAVKAAAAGMTVVCTLHTNSERPILRRLQKLLKKIPGIPEVRISSSDADPFSIR